MKHVDLEKFANGAFSAQVKDWTLLWKNIRGRKEGAAWPDRRSKAFFTFHLI